MLINETLLGQIGIFLIFIIEIAFFIALSVDKWIWNIMPWICVIFFGCVWFATAYPYVGASLIFIIFPSLIIFDELTRKKKVIEER